MSALPTRFTTSFNMRCAISDNPRSPWSYFDIANAVTSGGDSVTPAVPAPGRLAASDALSSMDDKLIAGDDGTLPHDGTPSCRAHSTSDPSCSPSGRTCMRSHTLLHSSPPAYLRLRRLNASHAANSCASADSPLSELAATLRRHHPTAFHLGSTSARSAHSRPVSSHAYPTSSPVYDGASPAYASL
jgi:hypothetical protein